MCPLSIREKGKMYRMFSCIGIEHAKFLCGEVFGLHDQRKG